MNKIEIGNKIATLRKEKGYTQKQLAEKLYVTDRAVSNWERGSNLPDLVILEPLAKELDTTISNLLDLNDESSLNDVVNLAIIQRNELIDEIKIENNKLIILYFVCVCLLLLSMSSGWPIIDYIHNFTGVLIGIPFGVSIRNYFRIKDYYKVKIK